MGSWLIYSNIWQFWKRDNYLKERLKGGDSKAIKERLPKGP